MALRGPTIEALIDKEKMVTSDPSTKRRNDRDLILGIGVGGVALVLTSCGPEAISSENMYSILTDGFMGDVRYAVDLGRPGQEQQIVVVSAQKGQSPSIGVLGIYDFGNGVTKPLVRFNDVVGFTDSLPNDLNALPLGKATNGENGLQVTTSVALPKTTKRFSSDGRPIIINRVPDGALIKGNMGEVGGLIFTGNKFEIGDLIGRIDLHVIGGPYRPDLFGIHWQVKYVGDQLVAPLADVDVGDLVGKTSYRAQITAYSAPNVASEMLALAVNPADAAKAIQSARAQALRLATEKARVVQAPVSVDQDASPWRSTPMATVGAPSSVSIPLPETPTLVVAGAALTLGVVGTAVFFTRKVRDANERANEAYRVANTARHALGSVREDLDYVNTGICQLIGLQQRINTEQGVNAKALDVAVNTIIRALSNTQEAEASNRILGIITKIAQEKASVVAKKLAVLATQVEQSWRNVNDF